MKKFTLLNFLALTLLIQVVFVNAAYAKSTVGWVSYTCNDRPVVSGMDCNAGYDAMGPKNSCMAGVATCPVGQIFSCESATCYTPSTGTAAAAACPTATIGGVTYSALTMALDSSKLGRLVQCGDNLVKSYFGPLAFNSDGSISNVLAGGAVTIKDSDGFKVISDKGLGSGATTSIDGNGVIMNVTSNTGGSNEERTIDTSNAYSLTISRVSNSMGEAAGGLLKIFNNDLMLGAAGKIQMGNYSNDGMGGPLTFSSYVDLNGTGLNVNVPTKISDAGGYNEGLQINGRIRTGTNAATSNGGMWVNNTGFFGSMSDGRVGIWNNDWALKVDTSQNVEVKNHFKAGSIGSFYTKTGSWTPIPGGSEWSVTMSCNSASEIAIECNYDTASPVIVSRNKAVGNTCGFILANTDLSWTYNYQLGVTCFNPNA